MFLFQNCASQQFQHIDKEKIISSLDFTKYQKNDFLITPGEYGAKLYNNRDFYLYNLCRS